MIIFFEKISVKKIECKISSCLNETAKTDEMKCLNTHKKTSALFVPTKNLTYSLPFIEPNLRTSGSRNRGKLCWYDRHFGWDLSNRDLNFSTVVRRISLFLHVLTANHVVLVNDRRL